VCISMHSYSDAGNLGACRQIIVECRNDNRRAKQILDGAAAARPAFAAVVVGVAAVPAILVGVVLRDNAVMLDADVDISQLSGVGRVVVANFNHII